MVLKRAVILKNYYMPNGLTSLIHKKNLQNCQGCWGKVKSSVLNVGPTSTKKYADCHFSTFYV